MKKIFFLVTVASAALASCVSNEAEVTPQADQKITFAAPLVSSITRAVTGEINNPYDKGESFVVFAKYYNPEYTNWAAGDWYMGKETGGVTVEYDATVNGWASKTTDYYWPKNGSLTFYAYSPADHGTWNPAVETADGSDKMTDTDVTIPANGANVDLLYTELATDKTANEKIDGNNGETAEYNGVELKFKHALSSIKYMVKLAAEYKDATIVLKKIEIKAKKQGNFSWDLTAENAPVWADQAATETYTVVAADTSVESTEAVAVENANVILLPQSLAGATAEENVVAVVTYTINDREYTTESDLSKLTYKEGEEEVAAEWQPGKRYVYTITFALDKIYFDPTVADWKDVTVTEKNI